MNCILAIRTFDTLDTLLNKIKRKEEGRGRHRRRREFKEFLKELATFFCGRTTISTKSPKQRFLFLFSPFYIVLSFESFDSFLATSKNVLVMQKNVLLNP